MNVFIVCILFIGCVKISNGDQSKRLLLNDPTIFQDRLNRMESLLGVLNSTVKSQALTIQKQETDIAQLKISKATGSTFIRWGRKLCPDNRTDLVYSGFAGGGSFDDTGSATDYICLTPDPKFGKTAGSDDFGRIYGGEYESNFWSSNSHDEDVPCVLCRSYYATTIMIPGTNICPTDWSRQYYGNLASGSHGHNAGSSFVCVDINPEYLRSGAANLNGKLFYNVVAKCGSLSCPPYINDHPVTCVVCSR